MNPLDINITSDIDIKDIQANTSTSNSAATPPPDTDNNVKDIEAELEQIAQNLRVGVINVDEALKQLELLDIIAETIKDGSKTTIKFVYNNKTYSVTCVSQSSSEDETAHLSETFSSYSELRSYVFSDGKADFEAKYKGLQFPGAGAVADMVAKNHTEDYADVTKEQILEELYPYAVEYNEQLQYPGYSKEYLIYTCKFTSGDLSIYFRQENSQYKLDEAKIDALFPNQDIKTVPDLINVLKDAQYGEGYLLGMFNFSKSNLQKFFTVTGEGNEKRYVLNLEAVKKEFPDKDIKTVGQLVAAINGTTADFIIVGDINNTQVQYDDSLTYGRLRGEYGLSEGIIRECFSQVGDDTYILRMNAVEKRFPNSTILTIKDFINAYNNYEIVYSEVELKQVYNLSPDRISFCFKQNEDGTYCIDGEKLKYYMSIPPKDISASNIFEMEENEIGYMFENMVYDRFWKNQTTISGSETKKYLDAYVDLMDRGMLYKPIGADFENNEAYQFAVSLAIKQLHISDDKEYNLYELKNKLDDFIASNYHNFNNSKLDISDLKNQYPDLKNNITNIITSALVNFGEDAIPYALEIVSSILKKYEFEDGELESFINGDSFQQLIFLTMNNAKSSSAEDVENYLTSIGTFGNDKLLDNQEYMKQLVEILASDYPELASNIPIIFSEIAPKYGYDSIQFSLEIADYLRTELNITDSDTLDVFIQSDMFKNILSDVMEYFLSDNQDSNITNVRDLLTDMGIAEMIKDSQSSLSNILGDIFNISPELKALLDNEDSLNQAIEDIIKYIIQENGDKAFTLENFTTLFTGKLSEIIRCDDVVIPILASKIFNSMLIQLCGSENEEDINNYYQELVESGKSLKDVLTTASSGASRAKTRGGSTVDILGLSIDLRGILKCEMASKMVFQFLSNATSAGMVAFDASLIFLNIMDDFICYGEIQESTMIEILTTVAADIIAVGVTLSMPCLPAKLVKGAAQSIIKGSLSHFVKAAANQILKSATAKKMTAKLGNMAAQFLEKHPTATKYIGKVKKSPEAIRQGYTHRHTKNVIKNTSFSKDEGSTDISDIPSYNPYEATVNGDGTVSYMGKTYSMNEFISICPDYLNTLGNVSGGISIYALTDAALEAAIQLQIAITGFGRDVVVYGSSKVIINSDGNSTSYGNGVTRTDRYNSDGTLNGSSIYDAASGTTTYLDADGNITAIKDANGTITYYDENGEIQATRDKDGNVITYNSDGTKVNIGNTSNGTFNEPDTFVTFMTDLANWAINGGNPSLGYDLLAWINGGCQGDFNWSANSNIGTGGSNGSGGGGNFDHTGPGGYCPDGTWSPTAGTGWGPIMDSVIGVGGHGGSPALGGGGSIWNNNSYH